MPPLLGNGSLDGLHYIFFLPYQLGEATTNATLMWALMQPHADLGIILYCDFQASHGSYRRAAAASEGLLQLRELHAFWIHPEQEAEATWKGILEAAATDVNHPVRGRWFTKYDYYRAVRRGSFFYPLSNFLPESAPLIFVVLYFFFFGFFRFTRRPIKLSAAQSVLVVFTLFFSYATRPLVFLQLSALPNPL
jgi:hypothetical protein